MAEHREWKTYDECGHDHEPEDPGVVDIEDIGLVCQDGFMYSVCFACHTHDGDAHEDTPEEQAWPCDAAKAQSLLRRVLDRNAPIQWLDSDGLLREDIEHELAGESKGEVDGGS